jgi:oligopeptide transport system substrate-binding protein
MRIVLPIVLLLAALLGALAMDRPLPRADFVFINRGDVSTLDPAIISWLQDNRVMRMVGEGLTRNDILTDNFETTPAACERWEISPDGLDYTFFLRKNARWSNGSPLTAHDFIFSWRRNMLPDLAGDYAKLYAFIEGGEQFMQWRSQAIAAFGSTPTASLPAGDRAKAAGVLWQQTLAKFDELVRVKAVDDHTLSLRLVRRTPYFIDLLAFPPMFPVYPPSVRAYESLDARTGMLRSGQQWTKPPHAVHNGPFTLTSWRFKREMRFEKNPHYWNKDALAIDSVSIPSMADANASVLAFRTGSVDWVSDVVPGYRAQMYRDKLAFLHEHREQIARLRSEGIIDAIEIDRRLPKDPRAHIQVLPAFGMYFYSYNVRERLPDGRDNPLTNPLLRRALAMAIDKQAIADNIRGVGEPAASTIIPEGMIPGYTSPDGLPFDPAKARELLAQAGYPQGKGLIPIEILFNKDGGHDLIAQAVAKDWQRELGIRVELVQRETKVFRENLKGGNFMVARGSWFGDYNDPTTFLNLSKTGDGNNDRGFSNPAFDALLAKAEEQPTPEARLAMLTEAERMLVQEEMPILPIFRYNQLYLFDPHRISGISPHPRMEQQMHRVDVLGDGKGSDTPAMMRRGDSSRGTFRIERADAP